MKVRHHVYANALLLAPEGRLDHETTPEFREVLMGSVRRCAGEELTLVLDLSNLEYLSSPGLNALIIASRNARKEGVGIHAAGLQTMVRETFEISHLPLLVRTSTTVEEAMQLVSEAAARAYAAAKAVKA
jgi:anti-anti-sigma factor